MRITIIYDNTTINKKLKADWGFACLIEAYGRKILFDTGAKEEILLQNLKNLNIDINEIDEIFISHKHWDHTGSLKRLLKIHPFTLYLPPSYQIENGTSKIHYFDKPSTIHKNFYTTGEINNIEQSLIVNCKKGLIIIVGCSHSGLENILKCASSYGSPYALIGGFHDFNDFNLLKNLHLLCPTHCTKHIKKIKKLYPEITIQGGAGQIIEIEEQ